MNEWRKNGSTREIGGEKMRVGGLNPVNVIMRNGVTVVRKEKRTRIRD